jgi:predicted NBD/HSP70 family sugar kinase
MILDLPVEPLIHPPLDNGFRPAALVNRAFRKSLDPKAVPLVITLERSGGEISRFETRVFPDDHPKAIYNQPYVERLVKFLLWQRGGCRLTIGGSVQIAEYLRECYSPTGLRSFDSRFMSERVYERPFEVIACRAEDAPASRETGRHLGHHLDGCRIGFDFGASDRKVSAVIDGQVVYSEEVVWQPKDNPDPNYHYQEILRALKTAAEKLPRLDAIGGSSAGIIIDNRPMVASLFRSVPEQRFAEVKDIFRRISAELGVPLVVINDGDVTALAGSMSLGDNAVLGIALGSSQAAGYVDPQGCITGWLNELAFAPVDYSLTAPVEEWSGDFGCGASYLSQQCVFRLAPQAGISVPVDLTDADKLKYVQEKLEAGHPGAVKIWQTMGVYLGYALAHYADFYQIRHVMILGRCTSGSGGELIVNDARQVLETEFPELASRIQIHLPDESTRRVGQAIAAASLPQIIKEQP